MKKLLAFLGIIAILGIQGCSTDFEVTGDYSEFAVVYGLLDLNDNPGRGGNGHNIRIQKAFLGELDAAIMAANPDSNYFPYNDLVVTLKEYNTQGNEVRELPLDTMMLDSKDTTGGFGFFGPEQRVYHTNEDLVGGFDYELLIHNMRTGYRDSATILLINADQFEFKAPNQTLTNAHQFKLYNQANSNFIDKAIRLKLPTGVMAGEIWVRFNYRDVVDGQAPEEKYLEWSLGNFSLDAPSSAGDLYQTIMNGEQFYQIIGSSLEPINGYRIVGYEDTDQDGHTQDIELFAYFGGKDLADYIRLNAPSGSGALTDNINYSNMAVGKGLFSSRSRSDYPNDSYLDTHSSDLLVSSDITSGLGFTN